MVARYAESILPPARRADLVIREVDDELVVYDLRTDQAHCLNPWVAAVWARCDGRTTVAEAVSSIGVQLQVSVADHVVWNAVRALHELDLLEEEIDHGPESTAISRRTLLKMGAAAAATVPIIMTIDAPIAFAVCSGTGVVCGSQTLTSSMCCGTGCTCPTGFQCCDSTATSGTCSCTTSSCHCCLATNGVPGNFTASQGCSACSSGAGNTCCCSGTCGTGSSHTKCT